MNFYNYINETTRDEKLRDIISNKCRPFINDLKKCNTEDDFLYSGRNRNDNYFIGNVRKNRRPSATKRSTHELFDKTFYNVFGIKARSQTIFCDILAEARYYGLNQYCIFPIGKYEIIWSPTIRDLFVDKKWANWDNLEKWIEENYVKGNLCKALPRPTEKMIYCDDYLAINNDAYNPQEIYYLIKDL